MNKNIYRLYNVRILKKIPLNANTGSQNGRARNDIDKQHSDKAHPFNKTHPQYLQAQ